MHRMHVSGPSKTVVLVDEKGTEVKLSYNQLVDIGIEP